MRIARYLIKVLCWWCEDMQSFKNYYLVGRAPLIPPLPYHRQHTAVDSAGGFCCEKAHSEADLHLMLSADLLLQVLLLLSLL